MLSAIDIVALTKLQTRHSGHTGPEIQAFCYGLKVDDPAFRPKQRLGLGPTRCYEHCIDLRIAPGDLFRPCPDPETDDTTCELDFRGTPPPRVRNIADYRQSFVGLSASLYRHGGEWAQASSCWRLTSPM